MDDLTGETGKKITACLDKHWPSFEALEEDCKKRGGRVTIFDFNKDDPPGWGCAVIEWAPKP